jgi:RNA polymerase sigma-70 factor (ECF subfamily)
MYVVTVDAFADLVTRHHAEIYRYLVRVTGRASDADDLSQETFFRAFRACAGGGPDGDCRAWLFAIATNLSKNYFRSQKRRQRAQHELLLGWGDRAAGLDGESGGRDLGEAVERMVAALPVKQRLAFVQRKVHGFAYETIAENLGCSPESARANVFQATKKIRRALDGHAPHVKEEP